MIGIIRNGVFEVGIVKVVNLVDHSSFHISSAHPCTVSIVTALYRKYDSIREHVENMITNSGTNKQIAASRVIFVGNNRQKGIVSKNPHFG